MRAADAATIRGGTPSDELMESAAVRPLRGARAGPSGLAPDLGRLRSRQQRRRRPGRGPPPLRDGQAGLGLHARRSRRVSGRRAREPRSPALDRRLASRASTGGPRSPSSSAASRIRTASWMRSSEPGLSRPLAGGAAAAVKAILRVRAARSSRRTSPPASRRTGGAARRRGARGDHGRLRRAEAVSRAASGERTLRTARRRRHRNFARRTLEAAARKVWLTETSDVRALLPPRPTESHKADFGRVAIVAGSKGKTGAAILAARGALRGGAGLVTVCCAESMQDVVVGALPEAMTLGLPESGGVPRRVGRSKPPPFRRGLRRRRRRSGTRDGPGHRGAARAAPFGDGGSRRRRCRRAQRVRRPARVLSRSGARAGPRS